MDAQQDPNQKAFHVTCNSMSFSAFNGKMGRILSNFENEFQLLSCQLDDYFENSKQPEDEFNRKMEWCKLLKVVILKYNPTWLFNIVPTGSTVSGLATKNSDLDVAIHIPQAAKILEERCAEKKVDEFEKKHMLREMQLEILQIVRLILENDEELKARVNWKIGVQLVQAQIQILKFETVDGIECDISVIMEHFLSSMHNSFLIRQLNHIDGRFAPLCGIVKEWAASTGVKNPKDGGFNSYALVLLVIHFLQCGTYPPILPNLLQMYKNDNFIAFDDKRFPLRLDFGGALPRPLPTIRKNSSHLVQLFLEFLHYYATFDFQKQYISFRTATIDSRVMSKNENVRMQQHKEVFIEDPFDLHNPGRTVRTITHIKKIMTLTLNMFVPPIEDGEDFEAQNVLFKLPSVNDIIKMPPPVFDGVFTGDTLPDNKDSSDLDL